jgi:hypothetical protein
LDIAFVITAMRFLAIIILWAFFLPLMAQDQSPYHKFGSISIPDLQKTSYPIDSQASAVVLMDRGLTSIEGNVKGWFSVVIKRHNVIHILNKNGYHEADIEIPLYDDGDHDEKLKNLKAATYNIENGRLKTTKLFKTDLFKEDVNKNLVIRKFTMPDIREGSIIEIEYEVVSDFITNLDPWYFQGASPVLWSEFILSLPQFFSYGFLKYGYKDFYVNNKTNRTGSFMVIDENKTNGTGKYNFSASITDYRWVMKDLPEIREESFTSTIKNHIVRMEFQLASHNPPLAPKTFTTTWPMLTSGLIGSEHFGNVMEINNNWLADEVKAAIKNPGSDTEKARMIFEYIRDHYTCNDHSALWRKQTLKNLTKTKRGSVSEINLLLVAMLRYAGLNSYPVILSTTNNGYVPEAYPLITGFNYVIARLQHGSEIYYIDASQPRLGFGKLLPECYNGHARIVDQEASAINLSADSVVERKTTALFLSTNNKEGWTAGIKQTPGYFESYNIRSRVSFTGKDVFFDQIQNQYGMDVTIHNPRLDSLYNFEAPVQLQYQLKLRPVMEDVLYINPMFGEGYKTNPFQSNKRNYPVEMPYALDETFILTMDIPDGYVVEEMPKSIMAKINEDGNCFFEYLVQLSGNTISLRSRVRIGRTVFMPSEYEFLQHFFDIIVDKQNERIVFRKK